MGFDRAACLARLARFVDPARGASWREDGPRLPMAEAEARFWLRLLAVVGDHDRASLLAQAQDLDVARPLRWPEAAQAIASTPLPEAMTVPLCGLPPYVVCRALRAPFPTSLRVAHAFRERALPDLDGAARERLRRELEVAPEDWPTTTEDTPSALFFLAAALGMRDAILPVVESWPAPADPIRAARIQRAHQPHWLLLALSRDEALAHFRRLSLRCPSRSFLEAWLALTGVDGVEPAGQRLESPRLLARLAQVLAPETGRLMAGLHAGPLAVQAQAWLAAHPALAPAPTEADRADRERLERRADAARDTRALRAGLELERLPALTRGGEAVPLDEVRSQLEVVRAAAPFEVTPGVRRFAAGLDPESRAVFGDAFGRHHAGDLELAPPLCHVLALFGGPGVVGLLAPDKEVDPERWRAQLEAWRYRCSALQLCGSDEALRILVSHTAADRPRSLRDAAFLALSALAAERGCEREELFDAVAPDFDCADRRLSYGERSFRLVFDPSLKPRLRCADGSLRKGLPRARKSDDPARVAEAKARWKRWKKNIAAFSKGQRSRLKQAMLRGRRWAPDSFRAQYTGTGLRGLLARRLIWGAFAPDGALLFSFRVDADGAACDLEDSPRTLPEDARIGLIDANHLRLEELERWLEILRDYELFQPFTQLSRVVLRVEPGDAEERQLPLPAEATCRLPKFFAILRNTKWIRDPDGRDMLKDFPRARQRAFLRYRTAGDEVELERVVFQPFDFDATGGLNLALGQVHPVVFSDVARVVAAILR